MKLLKAAIAGMVLGAITGTILLLSGCSTLKPAAKYLPGQQYGGDGTPCMNGACPVINQPKSWLKPCGE